MCYNNMCARLEPRIGQLAISKMGHDTKRLYVIVGVLSAEFCLVCDGEYRKLAKPKQKRFKHLRIIQHSQDLETSVNSKSISDELIRATLKQFL